MQAGSEGDLAPIGEGDLRGEEVEVEVNSRSGPQKQNGKHQQQNQTQNPSALLHAFSVRQFLIMVCWYVLTRMASGLRGISICAHAESTAGKIVNDW